MSLHSKEPPIKVIGDPKLTIVSPHLTVAEEEVIFPGGQRGKFTFVQDSYVATSVVPYDKRHGKKGIVLIEQYRHPSRSWGWEIPAGRPNSSETSEQAAARELAEEAGYEAELWQQLPSQNTFIGRGNSKVDTHLAAGLHAVGHSRDAEEVINAVEWFPMHRVYDMMLGGDINSSHTLGALVLADAFMQAYAEHPVTRKLR